MNRRFTEAQIEVIVQTLRNEVKDETDELVGSTNTMIHEALTTMGLHHFYQKVYELTADVSSPTALTTILRNMIFETQTFAIWDAQAARQVIENYLKLLSPDEIDQITNEIYSIKRYAEKKPLTRAQFIENVGFIMDVLTNHEAAFADASIKFSIDSWEPSDDGDPENGPHFNPGGHILHIWAAGVMMDTESAKASLLNRTYNHTLDAKVEFEPGTTQQHGLDAIHAVITWEWTS